VKLGAIADLHGDAEAAAKVAVVLTNEKVDAILALGDLGATEGEIAGVLASLGRARLPLFALAGEAEAEDLFHAAVKRVRASGVDIVDLVDLRIVDTGELEIVSAPGYRYSPRGCRYDERDVQALAARVGRPKKPILLAAHAPPRDDGADGVDRGFGDANLGDPALRALATAIEPSAALCAHIDEAGGRAHGPWLNIGTRVAVVEVAGGQARSRVLP
jgi:Icc-related predicted phosphoesterase